MGATPLTGGLLLPFINDGCDGSDDSSSAGTFDADPISLLLLSGGGLLLTNANWGDVDDEFGDFKPSSSILRISVHTQKSLVIDKRDDIIILHTTTNYENKK